MFDNTQSDDARLANDRVALNQSSHDGNGAADARYLNSFVRGMAVTQMIGAVCEIGLPDALPETGFCGVDGLAGDLDVNARALWRIARTLSAFGVFTVNVQGQVSHNARSLMLRTRNSPSQHWAARFWISPGIWQAWGSLRHSLKTGEEAFLDAHGRQFFDYMHGHVNEEVTYQKYMAGGYPGRHEAIASILEVSGGETVVDVGGGTGILVQALLDRYPSLAGVIYDQPEVIASLPPVPSCSRKSAIAGNFFESVPSNGDVYILSWVLHDWPDDKARDILTSCHQAMTAASRLVIVERLLDDNPVMCDPFDLLLDINMLVLHEGQERTRTEFDALLGSTGFAPLKLIRAQPTFSVFETTVL